MGMASKAGVARRAWVCGGPCRASAALATAPAGPLSSTPPHAAAVTLALALASPASAGATASQPAAAAAAEAAATRLAVMSEAHGQLPLRALNTHTHTVCRGRGFRERRCGYTGHTAKHKACKGGPTQEPDKKGKSSAWWRTSQGNFLSRPITAALAPSGLENVTIAAAGGSTHMHILRAARLGQYCFCTCVVVRVG